MSEFLSFRPQVALIARRQRGLERDALDDLEPETLDPRALARVVGQQANLGQAEIDQDLRAQTVIAGVGREAEVDVGFDGVHPAILQVVGLQLWHQAYPSAFVVAQVDYDTATLLGYALHRGP